VLSAGDSHDGDMTTTTPASTPTPALDRFFATLRRSPVTSSHDRVIAGVSAGVADRLGVSRAVVRMAMVALGLLGPGVFLYLLAWLMVPDAQGQIRLERAIRGGEAASIVLLVVTVLSAFSTLFGGEFDRGPGMHAHTGPWPLLILAGLALIGFKKGWFSGRGHRNGHRGHQEQAPATPTAPTTTPEGPQDAPPA